MRSIFLGKKPAGAQCLRYLAERGVEVTAVIASEPDSLWSDRVIDTADNLGIPLRSASDLVWAAERLSSRETPADESLRWVQNIDVIFSFMFWERIKEPLISLPSIGVINFHGAPLPGFRGVGSFNTAILEGVSHWGATAHFIDDERFDRGSIIATREFDIVPKEETAFSLEQKSLAALVELFTGIVDDLLAGKQLPRTPQVGKGRYISSKEYNARRSVTSDMTAEEVDRTIRAFWYPPYQGATIEIDGKAYTLINDELLEQIAPRIHHDRRL